MANSKRAKQLVSTFHQIGHVVSPRTGAIGVAGEPTVVTFQTLVNVEDPSAMAKPPDRGMGYGVYRSEPWTTLEKRLTEREGGCDALCVANDQAAVHLIMKRLPINSHVVVIGRIDDSTDELLSAMQIGSNLNVSYAQSVSDLDEIHRRSPATLVFSQASTKDEVRAIAAFGKKNKEVITAIDCIIAPPSVKPLSHGIDLVIPARTHVVSGPVNTPGGAIVIGKSKSAQLKDCLRNWRNMTGPILNPDDAQILVEHPPAGKRAVTAFRAARPIPERPDASQYASQAAKIAGNMVASMEGGSETFTVPTGRSAIELVTMLLPPNSHIIVAPPDMYPGSRKLFAFLEKTTGLQVTYAETTREALEAARKPNTRMIITEPMTNPMMKVSNLKVVMEFAEEHGLISVADNTSSPDLKPFDYDFDISCSSKTKYLAGHNNAMGGIVMVGPKASHVLVEKLHYLQKATGQYLSERAALKLIPLIQDYPLRMPNHHQNGLKVAERLVKQTDIVEAVHYPGLKSHPDHELAKEQFGENGYGGLMTFRIKGGKEAVKRFMAVIETANDAALADSFGAGITLFSWLKIQSAFFAGKSDQEAEELGVNIATIRLSVGRGDPKQIIALLQKALDAARTALEPECGQTKEAVTPAL